MLGVDIYRNSDERGPTLRQFATHFAHYSEQNLLFDIDAFRGLLSKSTYPSYYGIPIFPRDDSISDSTTLSKLEINVGFA